MKFQTPGLHFITLTGTDPGNATGSDSFAIQVAAPPTAGPPVIVIHQPTPNEAVFPSTPKALIASGNDPDGKSPISYQWVLIDGAVQQTLGTVQANTGATTAPVWWTPQEDNGWCSLKPVTIELRAQDADGEPATENVTVHIHHNPC